ncbi:MAG: hypothetical protein U1E72_03590 [Burkholderiaceae bacterium]
MAPTWKPSCAAPTWEAWKALSKFRHHIPALALALHVVDGGTGR